MCVLAAAAYGEKSGTTTNIEGRVTTLSEKVTPRGTSRPDWMIAVELADLLGGALGFTSVDDVTDAIAANVAGFGEATVAALRTARDGIVCKGIASAGRPHESTRSTLATATTTASSSVASCTTTRSARPCRRHSHIWRSGSELHLHPLDVERVGSTDGADVKVTSKRASMVFKVVADDTRRARLGMGAVQPAGTEHR